MSVMDVRDRLAAHYRLITGIKHVYPALPKSIQPNELPAVIVRAANADYTQTSSDGYTLSDPHYFQRRVFRVQVFVNEINQGMDGQIEDTMLALLDAVRDYFDDRPGLQLATDPDISIPAVYSHRLLTDTGAVGSGRYPNNETAKEYGVIEFRHTVETIHLRNFRD